ncbi:hypothetical protein C8A05DRAFT_14563, partial [Staphylotrichum tortipilum]
VAFRGGNLAHWGLFLPDEEGSPEGTLVHIGVNTLASGLVKLNHRLYVKKLVVTRSNAQSVHPITGAHVTRDILQQVANSVYQARGYNYVTNNCQHFCLDVVKELHARYADLVLDAAVQDVLQHGTAISAVTNFTRG